jgi:hypothetical protein
MFDGPRTFRRFILTKQTELVMNRNEIRKTRIYLKFLKFKDKHFSKKGVVDEKVLEIVKLITRSQQAELLMDGEGTYYANLKETYLVLEYDQLHIINGIYYQNIKIDYYFYKILMDKFVRRIHRDRRKFKTQILIKNRKSLDVILDDVKKKLM